MSEENIEIDGEIIKRTGNKAVVIMRDQVNKRLAREWQEYMIAKAKELANKQHGIR
jgi:hypothetical protein